MSVQLVLDRIAQIESMLASPAPASSATSTVAASRAAAGAGTTSSAKPASAGAASATFANELSSANASLLATLASEPAATAATPAVAALPATTATSPYMPAPATTATSPYMPAPATAAASPYAPAAASYSSIPAAAAATPAGGAVEPFYTAPAPTAAPAATAATAAVEPYATAASAAAPAAAPAAGNQAMVSIALSQVGVTEQPPGSNDGPAIATYRTATAGAMAGEPWCAYFASWVAREAGTPVGLSGQGLGAVQDIWTWAQQTGRAEPNGPGVVPRPGDLIVFGDHHVGIVDQVLPNGDVETIEGNYNDNVAQVIRGPGEATGYVRMS